MGEILETGLPQTMYGHTLEVWLLLFTYCFLKYFIAPLEETNMCKQLIRYSYLSLLEVIDSR